MPVFLVTFVVGNKAVPESPYANSLIIEAKTQAEAEASAMAMLWTPRFQDPALGYRNPQVKADEVSSETLTHFLKRSRSLNERMTSEPNSAEGAKGGPVGGK